MEKDELKISIVYYFFFPKGEMKAGSMVFPRYQNIQYIFDTLEFKALSEGADKVIVDDDCLHYLGQIKRILNN